VDDIIDSGVVSFDERESNVKMIEPGKNSLEGVNSTFHKGKGAFVSIKR
jgi:hypothetical protein